MWVVIQHDWWLVTDVLGLKRCAWPLMMGLIAWPETSVVHYKGTLRNFPKEQTLHLHRGGSLISQ